MDILHTSQQKKGEHHLTEGAGAGPVTNSRTDTGGGKGSFTQTSQQKAGELSLPGAPKVTVR